MKKKVKIAAAVAATGTAAVAAYYAIGDIFFRRTLSRAAMEKSAEKKRVSDDVLNGITDSSFMYDGIRWFRSAKKERVSIHAPEPGNLLHADVVYAAQPSRLWLVCCHGYTSYPENMGPYAMEFEKMGFNIVLPSLRGHDASDYDYVSMGWLDRLDTVKWTQWIAQEYPESQIVLFGLSMGAATVMMATGEDLPENVKCAIEDCGYTSVQEEFSVQIREMFRLPVFPFLNAAQAVTKKRAGYSFKQASCVEQLKKSKTPTLFIHGDADEFVPFYMLDKVYDAAVCEKEKLVVPNAAHAEAAAVEPELYWDAVRSFIGKYVEGIEQGIEQRVE